MKKAVDAVVISSVCMTKLSKQATTQTGVTIREPEMKSTSY